MDKKTNAGSYGKYNIIFKVTDKYGEPTAYFHTWTVKNKDKVLALLRDVLPPGVIDEMVEKKGRATIKIHSFTDQSCGLDH